MMYDKTNGYVIAILSNGKVLRESNGSVHLPFNSEYSIRLKNNKSGLKAQVEVSVDGTSIIGDERLVLNPHQSLDLERMILDGDNCSGRKLKFVPLDDDDVQDPTSSENGIVEVKFFEELNWPKIYIAEDPFRGSEKHPIWGGGIITTPNTDPHWRYHTGTPTDYLRSSLTSKPQHCYYSNSVGAGISGNLQATNCVLSTDAGSNGATVEGSESTQQFTDVQGFPVLAKETSVLRLKLVGIEDKKPVYVKDTRKIYCPECRKRNSRKFKFCPNCGTSLPR